jgi:outer membrane protein assembly factor BamA
MKRIYIFAVLLVIAPGLFAQENTITAISITGLKRTKPYIIETPLQKFIGRDAESININEVIAIVKSSSIVEPLTAEIKDNPDGNGKTLVITVREKWSILPIPLFSIDTGGWSAGAVFVDTNAFGVKDNMVLVGNFGINEWMVMAMYIHPPASVGSFGWDLMGNFLFQESESVDQKDEQLLRRFNSMSINPSIGLSYKLTDLITPSISVSYRNVILRDTESPINAPEDGVQAVGITPGIGITHNTWDGYFLSEKSASLKYDYTLVIGAADVHSVSLKAALNHSIIPGLRFNVFQ